MHANSQPPSLQLPPDVEDLLIDLHADGQEPPAALVDEWCRRHPEHESRIRGTVASLVQLAVEHPTAIGPWRIVRTLGEGGMGTVFLAEQEAPVHRQVALKVIKRGMDSRAVVARFERERQALAWMDDDGIAKVYDCGTTPQGQPYFVMEYVPGEPVTAFCDRLRMPVARRLELVLQVCAAVTHAHQKGIVHRDLKPSNVLASEVGGRARIKIIDFGLAKALHAQGPEFLTRTQAGNFVGTPEYAAPEQADVGNDDVDTRADVYSLGVVLYELLTGQLPLSSELLREVGTGGLAQILREVEPAKPSSRVSTLERDTAAAVAEVRATNGASLRRMLRNDLDWIVLRALEKDRARRYVSADALAADIRRYLAHEPLQAGPPSAGYRLRKLLRRYRGQFLGVAVVLVTAIAGAGLALDQAARARASLADAVDARRTANEQKGVAEQNAKDVKQVADFQTRMLSSVSMEAFGTALGRLLRREADAAARVIADDAERARALMAFDDMLRRTNLTNVARSGLREMFFDPAARTIDDYDRRPHLQPMLQVPLSMTCAQLGMLDLAERLARDARAQLIELRGARHIETLHACYVLGWCLESAGKLPEAEALLREVLDQGVALGHADEHNLLRAKNHLGVVLVYQGRHAEAEPLLTAALEGQRRLLGENHEETLRTMGNIAALYQGQARFADAERVLRDAIDRLRAAQGPRHVLTLRAVNNLATLLCATRRTKDAEPLQREALAGFSESFGDDHPQTQVVRANLALIVRDLGNLQEAESLLRDGVARSLHTLGDRAPTTANLQHQLGGVLLRAKKWAEAEAPLRAAFATRAATLGEDIDTFSTGVRLATSLRGQGHLDEAEALLADVVARQTKTLGPDHDETRRAADQLAALRKSRGR